MSAIAIAMMLAAATGTTGDEDLPPATSARSVSKLGDGETAIAHLLQSHPGRAYYGIAVHVTDEQRANLGASLGRLLVRSIAKMNGVEGAWAFTGDVPANVDAGWVVQTAGTMDVDRLLVAVLVPGDDDDATVTLELWTDDGERIGALDPFHVTLGPADVAETETERAAPAPKSAPEEEFTRRALRLAPSGAASAVDGYTIVRDGEPLSLREIAATGGPDARVLEEHRMASRWLLFRRINEVLVAHVGLVLLPALATIPTCIGMGLCGVFGALSGIGTSPAENLVFGLYVALIGFLYVGPCTIPGGLLAGLFLGGVAALAGFGTWFVDWAVVRRPRHPYARFVTEQNTKLAAALGLDRAELDRAFFPE